MLCHFFDIIKLNPLKINEILKMKSIKVLFAAMAIAFPSVAFATGAGVDGRLYSDVKARA